MQVTLNGEYGATVRLFKDDYDQMSQSEQDWIRQNSDSSGVEGRIGGIVSYYLTLSPTHYDLLRTYNRNAIKPYLFFALREIAEGNSFKFRGYDAYALVTALYAEAASVLKPTRYWSYHTANEYLVRYDADTQILEIEFPDEVVGLLIGKRGSSAKAVEMVLQPVVQKIHIVRS